MHMEDAKEYLKNKLSDYLISITTRKGNQFICPLCKSGTGENRTPAGSLTENNTYYHCFSCNFHGDIFDLIGAYERLEAPRERFKRAYDIFGAEMDFGCQRACEASITKGNSYRDIEQTEKMDFQAYIKKCKSDVSKTDYFLKRGLSKKTIEQYNLGYDSTKNVVVIPYGEGNSYYITRRIDSKQYFKLKGIPEPIYNLSALYEEQEQPVFIVESAIDALSIIDAEGDAIALNGTGTQRLLKALKDKPTVNTLIISLDNDTAGKKVSEALSKDLEALGVNSIETNISGDYKDPSEALQKDKDLFLKAVQEAYKQASFHRSVIENDKREKEAIENEKYRDETSAISYIQAFVDGIKERANTPAVSTNFPELDKVLDGGLYEGLYIIGAISSLGKTSLVLQISDQIAQQKQDVLIFSLEMSRYELMAKSISRITLEQGQANESNPKTTRGILAGKRYINYSSTEKALINDSIKNYATYADYLFIYEGVGDIGTEKIKEVVQKHIKATGNIPVVVIDYLQILAPFEPRATDKQNTDRNILELKRLSRDFKVPVVAISSLNRESYTTQISMSAFKESGAIEYSADVLMGLQFDLEGLENEGKVTNDIIDGLKQKIPRKIELKILKNRNGATGKIIKFTYDPRFNYFNETGKKSTGFSLSEPAGARKGKHEYKRS